MALLWHATVGPALHAQPLQVQANAPPVQRVVRVALQVQTRGWSPLDEVRTRQRLRGLLPVFRLGLRGARSRDTSATADNRSWRNRASLDEGLSLSATLSFRLDRLMYAPAEASLLREQRTRRRQRQQLAREVIALYFEREALLEGGAPARGSPWDGGARIREIEALLDVFTAGWFTRMMHRP